MLSTPVQRGLMGEQLPCCEISLEIFHPILGNAPKLVYDEPEFITMTSGPS